MWCPLSDPDEPPDDSEPELLPDELDASLLPELLDRTASGIVGCTVI